MRCSKAKLAAAIALIGCGSEPSDQPSPSAPVLEAVAATTRPGNVLSVLVTGRARFADSVAVRYGVEGTALDIVSPAEALADSEIVLPVFGLLPDTNYELQLIAYGDAERSSRASHCTSRPVRSRKTCPASSPERAGPLSRLRSSFPRACTGS